MTINKLFLSALVALPLVAIASTAAQAAAGDSPGKIFYQYKKKKLVGTPHADLIFPPWHENSVIHADPRGVKGGDDVMIFGYSTGIYRGGPGADRFVVDSASDDNVYNPHVITDFNAAEGDIIDLSAIDADTKTPGKQAFTYIGSAPFTPGVAGQLRFANGFLDGKTHGAYDEDETSNSDESNAHLLTHRIVLKGVEALPASALVLNPQDLSPAKKIKHNKVWRKIKRAKKRLSRK